MGKKILAVDDSASMRQMVLFTLQGAGYEVVQASDGVEALDWARESAADLVLTDVHMPRMDGITLVRELRGLLELQIRADADTDHRVQPGKENGRQTGRCHRMDRQAVQSPAAAGHGRSSHLIAASNGHPKPCAEGFEHDT